MVFCQLVCPVGLVGKFLAVDDPMMCAQLQLLVQMLWSHIEFELIDHVVCQFFWV